MSDPCGSVIPTGATVLIVDEDEAFLNATATLLRAEGYEPTVAASRALARSVLLRSPIQILLSAHGGLEAEEASFVREVRAKERHLQIILTVGHSGEAPSRKYLRANQILGVCDKAEGPERLLLWTDVARKAASATARLGASRRDMEMVLAATTSMHRHRDKAALYAEILDRAACLTGATGGLVGLFPDAIGEDGDLFVEDATGAIARVVASNGKLANCRELDGEFDKVALDVVEVSLSARSCLVRERWLSLPLRVGEHMLGFLALSTSRRCNVEVETLDLFSHQASVAIQNALYYEMAALDPLTGVHVRRFFEVWTRREVRAALRSGTPLGVMLLDMDNLKAINDQGGHRAGDMAIAGVGRVLREATREHDLAARLGGDEFAMLMPGTDVEGVTAVSRRVLELLKAGTVSSQGRRVALGASIGIAVLHCGGPCPAAVGRALAPGFFEELVERLVRRADESLYRAKRQGGSCVCHGESIDISWGAEATATAPSAAELA